MQLIRVVTVDDHPVMRLGLKALLLATNVRVVAESDSSDEAFRLVKEGRPDLVVLGLNLTEEPDGIELCRRIKALPDPPYVLVHTAHNSEEDVSSCFLTGADSYLHKGTDLEELLDAVRRTAGGEHIWRPGERVEEPRSRIHTTPGGIPLSRREREVLALVLRHHSNAEIAQALHVSPQTAKNHVSSILKKLGVRSRKELFARNLVVSAR
jgi:two-component system response regulator DevR